MQAGGVELNTRQKGDLSELLVLSELVRYGLRVAIPFGQSQGFDLLVENREGRWRKVQVKTAYRRGKRGNRIYVDTIRGTSLNKKRGYAPGSFDYLVAVLGTVAPKFWVIGASEMQDRRCLTIAEDRPSKWHWLGD